MHGTELIAELEPVTGRLLERHLAVAKEWFPHELVPWSRGRDFEADLEWEAPEDGLTDADRSSLFVNLLTEDNLPHYFATISRLYGRDTAWGEWSRRWTAEEGRHGMVIRDYLTVTRAIDPVELERARMAQVSHGEVPEPASPHEGLAYVALQELATRIAHHNTGKRLADPAGYEVMKRVAADENRHHLFYRDLVAAALEIDPSTMMVAIAEQVIGFEMPGTGIAGFARHARRIADAGIYDLAIHHDQILTPVLFTHWRIDALEGLDEAAEAARDRVVGHLARIRRVADRQVARRARAA